MNDLLNLDKDALKAVITSLQSFALYATIAVLVALIAVYVLLKLKAPEKLGGFRTLSVGIAIGYSVLLISIILFVQISRMVVKKELDFTFYFMIGLFAAALILLAVGFVLSVLKKDIVKRFAQISTGILGGIAVIFVIVKIFLNYKGQEINIGGEVQLYLYAALLIAAIAVTAFVFGKKQEFNQTKPIVYGAICIAMSFALSYIRFFELPQGGSITFVSLMPIMIYSFMFGTRKGVLIGIIYGILQFIQAPYFMHPVQFLLDYPIAFAAIGLTGILKEKNILSSKLVLQFALGAIFAVTLRYLSHVVSGIFVFGSADPENYSAVAWSFLYNLFTYVDLLILLVATCPLFLSKSFVKLIDVSRMK